MKLRLLINNLFLLKFLLILISLIAIFLRFYNLSSVPEGFHVDESSLGYNAWSVLKTGRDEWGEKLPLYFGSFGEFRLPLYFYLTVISVAFFGLNEFSVRFWAAFFGSLTVLFTFLLVFRIFKKNIGYKKAFLIALLTGTLLTFEPIHLHFSRMGIEVMPCLFFTLLGFYFLEAKRKISFYRFFLISLSFILSILSYHAARIFLPAFLLGLIFFNSKKEKKKYLIVFTIALIFIILTLNTKGIARLKGVSIFHPQSGIISALVEKINEHQSFKTPTLLTRFLHNKVVDYSLVFLKNYFTHFNTDFLFFIGDTHDKRFSLPFLGNFLLFELLFFVLGFLHLFKKKLWFFILWLGLSPLGSALTFLSPSASRSIFLMPAFQVIAAIGLVYSLDWFKNKLAKKIYLFLIAIFLIFNISLVLDSYFLHQYIHKPYYRDYGFKQVALKIKELEKDYDKIVIGKTESTYIHFLFFQKIDPYNIWDKIERFPPDNFGFQPAKKIGKYYFDSSCPVVDSLNERILYICDKEVDEDNFSIIKRINYKDGTLDFVIFEKKKKDEI